MRILLTGASGFVGRALLARVLADGVYDVSSAQRQLPAEPVTGVEYFQVPSLGPETEWLQALLSADVVIHCAARVHVMHEQSHDPLTEFRCANVEGTLRLARQAAVAGVKRFIFLSSIKVNGECSNSGSPYLADSQPAPTDPYGISKMEAEQGLRGLAVETGMQVVIIRPVLVYGPGVKANFLSMMRWLYKGVPLPFGAIDNSRSLVALDNLVDLIVTCIEHPAAANQIFLVSDGEELSTTELLRKMGVALGKSVHLLPIPSRVLKVGAAMLGKQVLAQRLCGSLQVDISKTHELLGWSPPVDVDEALRRTAVHFLAAQNDSND